MTDSLFLTKDELHELTGYRQFAKQIAMLRKSGIPFWENASGQPKVARAYIEGRRQADQKPAKTWEPSWAGGRA